MKNALQQFKQKGRILRAYLSSAFGTEVKLTQAYEAVAKMEGAENWHVFSAQLAGKPDVQATPSVTPAETKSIYSNLPGITAVFRTVDGKSKAKFDAKPWFDQASNDDIRSLLLESLDGLDPDLGFNRGYGGESMGWSIAEFFRGKDEAVDKVYAYIDATHAVGVDCGGSDCVFSAIEVLRYLSERFDMEWTAAQAGESTEGHLNFVLDSQLGYYGENYQLVVKICKSIWASCVEGWKSRDSLDGCEYIIESTDIFNALSEFDIVGTGEDGYSDEVEELIENALSDLGYHRQARLLYEGKASLDDVFPVVSESAPATPVEVKHDTLKVFEVLMQDIVGDYDVPDGIPEWEWVQRNAAFSHRSNGEEGGVWEFMVHTDILDDDQTLNEDPMPERLKPLFEDAWNSKASWIMFHQGT